MGVERIPTVGMPFSPEIHEAVAAEETDDPEKNGIITGRSSRDTAPGNGAPPGEGESGILRAASDRMTE